MSHICHATGCTRKIPPSMWGCKTHWFMVPEALRREIWKHYRAGQEDDWEPSRAYLLAARAAVVAVAALEEREPKTIVYDMFLERTDG